MTRFLVDADIAIYAMAGGNDALKQRFTACVPGEIALSSVSLAEIALGSHAGKPPPPEVLDAFIRVVPVIPFDAAAAWAYARLPFRRARFDRLLAAHALSIGAIVVTNNQADFADVTGLDVENWTVD